MNAPQRSSSFFLTQLSVTADRVAEIERSRVFHRVIQGELATAALITCRYYRMVVADPSRASEAVLVRLETAMRGLAAARGAQVVPKISTSPTPEQVRATFAALFLATCQYHGLTPSAARELLRGEERPAEALWKRASHARQDAGYLVNQALGVPQKDIAALIGKSAAAVSLAMRSVEDRRDDPVFDAFCEEAQLMVRDMAT